jgi:TPR repeat protein
MEPGTYWRFNSVLCSGITAIALTFSANFAEAQQIPTRLAADSSAPQPAPSAEDAYHKGREFEQSKNYAEAMRWYRLAAGRGNADAQVGVGNLYAMGLGVPQNYGEALRWYRLAADQGNSEAEDSLGFFYLSGWGVPQDYAEGLRWFTKAADQGNEVAQRNIGMIYLQGLGVAKNRDEAIRWFRKAAGNGDPDAMNALKVRGAD